MFKNKEIQKLVLIQIIVFLIFIILSLLFSNLISNFYKNEILKNNSYIIGNILNEHPELENNIIDSIINHNGDKKLGYQILKKYGLADISSLDYLDYNENIKRRIIAFNIIFALLLFIILELIYLLFTKKQYKKINEIDTYMNNILNNNYSLDIREYLEGDISNLKNDIYKMTVKLKEQIENSKKDKIYLEETLSDISHQIRTPLTSMYVINDILMDNEISYNDKKEFLIKNKTQLERIEWLVTSLLKMSRLDSGSIILKKEKVNLKKLIDTSVEPLKIPIELKNINLEIICDSKIYVDLDFNWTCEALVNIIKNAYEHTKEYGLVSINCSTNPIYTEIKIKDNGEGINSNDLPHIFERFYKGKHNKESIGIGLNMAKKIIDMQGNDISVTSKLNEGTEFSIKIYKKII